MKILIVTQHDPFYLPYFFESFFNRFGQVSKDIEIVGVVIQRPLGQRSKIALLRRMIDFYGSVMFVIVSLVYMLRVVEKKLNKMHLLNKAHSIEYYCRKHGARILPYRNVNHQRFIEFVHMNKIDLIVSVAASQIFKPSILKAPRLGCINVHNAPLPEYRGMMPSFWQMFYGQRYAVATIHEMVEEVDKGRIIFQARTEIEKGMTLDALIRKTRIVDAEAVIEVLRMFRDGQVVFRPLPQKKSSYFSFPGKRDVAEFRSRGHRIL